MPFKSIIRELKGKNGLNNKQKKLSEAKCVQGHTKSHITTPSKSALVQENLWAILPSELLLDIFGRVEENETTWPARMAVVACAGVCRSWREVAKEVVKTPEECGLLTFPMSLKQPGPRDSPIQCFIKRERTTSTYLLYLGLSPAAKRIRRATKTDFLISLSTKDFTQTSNNYVGNLRSNFFGSKFVIHDCQPPSSSAIQSHGWSHKKVSTKKVSPRLTVCNYNVATISYELNVLRTRGPRKMQSNMQTIPVSAIQEGGSATTPATFSSDLKEMFSPFAGFLFRRGVKYFEFTGFSFNLPDSELLNLPDLLNTYRIWCAYRIFLSLTVFGQSLNTGFQSYRISLKLHIGFQ